MTVAVRLTSSDTLAGAIARLQSADAERVLIVVPKGLRWTEVDLRVLRREAARRGVNIALLTTDAGLRRLAARAGVSTFRSRWWAERVPWQKPRLDPKVGRPPVGSAVPTAPPAPGLYSRRSPTGFRPTSYLRSFVRSPGSWWGLLGLTACLLLMVAGLFYVLSAIIPAATITVTPAAEPIRVTVELRAIQDAPLDIEAGIVPARALSAQASGEARMATTGRSLEPDKKARGQVVLINRTSSPILVPAGTVVSTATGNNVQFATIAEAPLAANGRATVPIEAVLPGPGSNVRAGTITRVEGPLALSVLVTNDVPTSGGTLARVGVVTEEDQKQLQAQLFERLKEQALARLMERLEPGSFIPPESVSYMALSPTFTPFVGEVASELSLSMGMQAVGLAVDSGAGSQIALARLQETMPPGTRLISDTLRYIPGPAAMQDSRTIVFTLTAEGTLLRGVDSGAVRNAVLGMSPDRAAQLLQERFGLAETPRITLGPDWLPYVVPVRLPVLPWRIRVLVDWDTAARLAGVR